MTNNLKLAHQIGWGLLAVCVISAFLIPTWLVPIVDGEDTFYVILTICLRALTAVLVWVVALVLGIK